MFKKTIIILFILGLITTSCAKHEALDAEIVTPAQGLEITEGQAVYFEGSASGGAPPYTYAWDFSVVAPPSTNHNPGKIVFNFEGAYKVVLTVKDSAGDMNTDFVRIIVKGKTM